MHGFPFPWRKFFQAQKTALKEEYLYNDWIGLKDFHAYSDIRSTQSAYSDNTMHFIDKSKLLGNIFGILSGLLDSNFVHLVVSNFFEKQSFSSCKLQSF